MILIGNQRGGATNLAHHLLKQENEQVDVLQVRGFASDDLHSAFRESYAMSKATKCKQHLFSLSLNPPKDAEVGPEEFEHTIDRAEEALGLKGQPRAIVLHTKNGRSHAHAVWSRIDVGEMRAVQMSFSKIKMQELSRELYQEHGWTMPRGFKRHEDSDPRNYTLAEWQQCKRTKRDPAKTKEIFQDAWAISDSKEAFANAILSHGFILAKGDRRGHVAVDHNGEAFAISRYARIKSKQVKARLGDPNELISKDDAHELAAYRVTTRLDELREQQKQAALSKLRHLSDRDASQRAAQARTNAALLERQNEERQRLHEEQQARLRTGFLGIVDRLTGKRKKTIEDNNVETQRAEIRAALERQHHNDTYQAQRAAIVEERKSINSNDQRIQRELAMDMHQLRELARSHQDKEVETNRGREGSKRRPRQELPSPEL